MLTCIAVLFATLLNEALQSTNLVDHIPLSATILAGASGAALGFWVGTAFLEADQNRPIITKFLAFLFVPGLFFAAGTHTARSVFTVVAFAGAETTVTNADLKIVGRSRRGNGLIYNARLDLRLTQETRQIRILVTDKLRLRAGARPQARKHFIRLRMETGRWGYRRVITPNYFDEPIGLQNYHKP